MNCNVEFPTINYLSNIYCKNLVSISKKFYTNFNNIKDDEIVNGINGYTNKLIGFDIPLLLTPNHCVTDKTIVILGESPLRNKLLSGTLIRTPFGIGSVPGLRGLEQCERYYNIIQNIIDLGYNVYVTDIIKVWVDDYTDKSKLNVCDKDIETFKDELEILKKHFKVDNIVCWGNKSYEAIKDNVNENIIHILHPSKMNVKYWKMRHNVSGSTESIVNKATELIVNNII